MNEADTYTILSQTFLTVLYASGPIMALALAGSPGLPKLIQVGVLENDYNMCRVKVRLDIRCKYVVRPQFVFPQL